MSESTQPAEGPEFYVATEELFIGRQRAANVGDEVPADNVERFGWHDQVRAPGKDETPGVVDLAKANIDQVLEHVGTDSIRAREALELERAKGEKARPTLVEQLQAIAGD